LFRRPDHRTDAGLLVQVLEDAAGHAEGRKPGRHADIDGHLEQALLISPCVTPFVIAAQMWPAKASGRFSAASMPILRMLRLRRSSQGRAQTAPQQNSVTRSYIGLLNSSAPAISASTAA
jgi:hypothetical protein